MKVNLTIRIPVWLDRIFIWPVLQYRKYKFCWPFRKICLGQGHYTIVDPDVYYLVRNFIWWLHANGSGLYAARTEITPDLNARIIYMHREIMQTPDDLVVDHRNNNSLDNRMANMRNVTQAENMRNRRKRKNTSSPYIGVSLRKKTGRFDANIRYDGKKICLGSFANEIDAARAYDAAAKKYFGDLIRLNFPDES
jgi:hypothetical protein